MITLAAVFNFGFGVFHLLFWKILNWGDQLKRVSDVNRAVIQTLNLCLTFMFFFVACIYFFYMNTVITTALGNTLLLGMALFWLMRAILQVYFFNMRERIHQLLLVIFIIGFAIHAIPLFGKG